MSTVVSTARPNVETRDEPERVLRSKNKARAKVSVKPSRNGIDDAGKAAFPRALIRMASLFFPIQTLPLVYMMRFRMQSPWRKVAPWMILISDLILEMNTPEVIIWVWRMNRR